MDLEYVKQCLQESGWKNLRVGSYAGTSFDLVGARRYFLDQWLILVKVIPALDMKMVQEVEEIYNLIAIKTLNQLWRKKSFYSWLRRKRRPRRSTALSSTCAPA
jgi:hypothetical protein